MGTHVLRQMAICAYALNEAGSIIENIDRSGWGEHIPAFIRNALARLQEKANGNNGSDNRTTKMINIMPERPDIIEQRRKAALELAAEKLEGMIKDVKRN